jgi:hypothetical protein
LCQAGYIPLSLSMAGNLCVQSCHMWMAATSKSNSSVNVSSSSSYSSGLHHDFHDNFYLLLHGQKQFVLYHPRFANQMYLNGAIESIHSNGLISYQSNPSYADGRPKGASHTTIVHDRDKNEMDRDSSSNEENESDDETDVEKYGKQFHCDLLDDDTSGPSNCTLHDDYDEWVGEDNHTGDTFLIQDESRKRKFAALSGTTIQPEPTSKHPELDHFSRVDPTKPIDRLLYPDFPSDENRMIITLQAGEALYLPASWFHCVTSSGDPLNVLQSNGHCVEQESKDHDKGNVTTNPFHMAINYWYYPPDNVDCFERPYCHGYLNKKVQ